MALVFNHFNPDLRKWLLCSPQTPNVCEAYELITIRQMAQLVKHDKIRSDSVIWRCFSLLRTCARASQRVASPLLPILWLKDEWENDLSDLCGNNILMIYHYSWKYRKDVCMFVVEFLWVNMGKQGGLIYSFAIISFAFLSRNIIIVKID
jgi:hypothetical protein